MPWHLVTRALFIAAVGWSAALTRAFHPALSVNIAVGVTLGLLIVLIETRLRSTEVTDLLGALIGGALCPGGSNGLRAPLFCADTSAPRAVFLLNLLPPLLPVLRLAKLGREGGRASPHR